MNVITITRSDRVRLTFPGMRPRRRRYALIGHSRLGVGARRLMNTSTKTASSSRSSRRTWPDSSGVIASLTNGSGAVACRHGERCQRCAPAGPPGDCRRTKAVANEGFDFTRRRAARKAAERERGWHSAGRCAEPGDTTRSSTRRGRRRSDCAEHRLI